MCVCLRAAITKLGGPGPRLCTHGGALWRLGGSVDCLRPVDPTGVSDNRRGACTGPNAGTLWLTGGLAWHSPLVGVHQDQVNNEYLSEGG